MLRHHPASGGHECVPVIHVLLVGSVRHRLDAGRVDGFYIVDSKAYIVDSQGPIYPSTSGKLGGSVYEVDWTNPCGRAAGTCSASTVSTP